MLNGIDVSRWQSSTPDLTGQSFLFARATYATTHDSLYATHIANARHAGLVTGAYHFGVNAVYVSIASQVAAFLAAATDADLYVLDLESDGSRTAMSAANALDFITRVKATGRKIGLYHSASGFPAVGQDWNWIAKWGTTPPSGAWTFWQWQGSPLDRDKYPGTLEQLRAFAGHPPASGDDVQYISAGGYDLTSAKLLALAKGTPILRLDGSPLTTVSADASVTVLGLIDGKAGDYAVLIDTSYGYPDDVTRPTVALVRSTVLPTDAPLLGDCAAAIASATGPLIAKIENARRELL